MMRNLRLVLAVTCLVAASPAWAQQVTAPTSSATPAAATVDPAALAKAKELMDMMHLSERSLQTMNVFAEQYGALIQKTNPGKAAQIKELIGSSFMPVFQRHLPEMTNNLATIYAQNFTADDMQAAITFYGSPAGQKFLNKSPQVMSQYMQQSQPLMIEMVKEALQVMLPKMKQNNLQVPKEMNL